MSRRRTAAVLLLFLLPLQAPARAQTSTGILDGRVVDARGVAMPLASVTIRPSGHAGNLTDHERESDDGGQFRFENLAPGRYRIAVRKTGFYLNHSIVQVSAGRPTALLLFMDAEPVAAGRPSATGQVRGRVLDEYLASIPDATVVFEPVDPHAGLTLLRARADARGRFDFEGVIPGAYRVTANALGYRPTVVVEDVKPGVLNEITLIMRPRSQRP